MHPGTNNKAETERERTARIVVWSVFMRSLFSNGRSSARDRRQIEGRGAGRSDIEQIAHRLNDLRGRG